MGKTLMRAYLIPIIPLGIMFILMLGSSWNDSAIIDELAHIPAGYSYLALRDYRLNPEHPPLIKDLAALPLLFTRVSFPTNVPSWSDDVNGQWTQGAIFLYEAGNNPDVILRLMRLPMMILAVFFGWLLWFWARRNFGEPVAHLALIFYSFSPTFITHSRFVTTDLAAAFGFFIGLAAFLKFLDQPSAKNMLLAGLAFGTAQLLKFSLILLLPIYGVLLVAWALSRVHLDWNERAKLFFRLLVKIIVIVIVAIALIWLIYAYHVWNYPAERQYRDAEFILGSFRFRSWVTFDLWLIQSDFLRPLGQYFLGLFMVFQRAAGGNTQYFLGEVTAAGSRIYFPMLYLLKESLALHIL
ncbi:MAG: glycosyltransferase family 39 protein, partial [Patescibacteria group bacterium]